jgi:hypothetical protein
LRHAIGGIHESVAIPIGDRWQGRGEEQAVAAIG